MTRLRSGLLVWVCCSLPAYGERIGSTSSPLSTTSGITLWTANGNEVPVCWETEGYDREKEIVRSAVIGTWEYFAQIRFTDWGVCPSSGSARHVRMRISPQGHDNSGAGGSAFIGMDALSAASDNRPGVHFTFNPDGSANRGRVEYVGVHELGHVLGFIHEQDTPGNIEGAAHCDTPGVDPHATPYTPYDRDSIMNYCNREGNMKGNLTDIDIAGVQAAYGVRRPKVLPVNSCYSGYSRQRASVAAPWNDGGLTTIAVFPSTGSSFGWHSQWNIRDGGWGDDVKWASGDFNGDGLSDIAAAWNYGGNTVLTVRASTGSGFTHAHWDLDAGGWMSSTQYLPGDFNGDGLTDIAAPWNDGGNASFAVYLSDRTRFLYRSQWAIRDGGWSDQVKWFAGDFNGDGRSDIGAAWNNDGRTTLTVRLSTGQSFTHEHWKVDAGRWSDSHIFLAGDFNGDGRADVVQLWNDLGQSSSLLFLSYGTQFSSPMSSTDRDGGWWEDVRWFPGDFNGDGRTDIGAAWNYGGTNVLTVRQSMGDSFAPSHWSFNAGGWMPSTAWCAGKFQ